MHGSNARGSPEERFPRFALTKVFRIHHLLGNPKRSAGTVQTLQGISWAYADLSRLRTIALKVYSPFSVELEVIA